MGIDFLVKNINNKASLSDREFRRIQLIQATNLMTVFYFIFFIFFFIHFNSKLLIINIVNLLFFGLIAGFNFHLVRKGKVEIAKYIILISLTIANLNGAVFNIGDQVGAHSFLILYAILPLLIFQVSRYFTLFYFIFNLSAFLFIEYLFPESMIKIIIPDKTVLFMKTFSFIATIIHIGWVIMFYQKIREEIEQKLLSQANELKEINKMKDKLISIIAHDLRNPFNSISMGLNLISEKYNEWDSEKRGRVIGATLENSKAASGLLENLLIWTRMQSKSLKTRLEDLKLTTVVEDVIMLYKEAVTHKRIYLRNNITDDLWVNTDQNLLQLILRNILSNAVKFTPPGGTITLSVKKINGSFTQILIEDTGGGIDSKDIPKLKQSTHQFTTNGTENENGSGMGLPLCFEAVKMLKGSIDIESEKGKGARFVVELPNQI